VEPKNGQEEILRKTNYNGADLRRLSQSWYTSFGGYVRDDGTLWVCGELHWEDYKSGNREILQSGRDTNWLSVATGEDTMVALKSDGTLWQWESHHRQLADAFTAPPTRLGIHHDWVAVTGVRNGAVSIAADGSLWFWPDRAAYEYEQALLQLPKQPQLFGNVFRKAD
jgi:alpha-tubulin suppressor-like RCC1 family protein